MIGATGGLDLEEIMKLLMKKPVEKVLKWFIDCINIIKERSNE